MNGEPARVYSAYLALRAVPVGRGQNVVRFDYTPATFRFSVQVSAASLVVIAICGGVGLRRRGNGASRIANVAK